MQGGNLNGIGNVDVLDIEPAIGLADKIVQSGFPPIAHGGDHMPAEPQVLFRDRKPETTRGAEQQKTFFRGRDWHAISSSRRGPRGGTRSNPGSRPIFRIPPERPTS